MKRPIVIVTMFYAAGLAAGLLLRMPASLALAAVALIALGQVVLLRHGRAANDYLLFAAVFILGAYRQDRIAEQDQAARDRLALLDKDPIVRLEARLACSDRQYENRQTFRLKDCIIHRDAGESIEFPTEVQLVCTRDALAKVLGEPPKPGDRVVATGRLERPPDLSNPNVFNYRAYLEREGLGASLFVQRSDALQITPPLVRSPAEMLTAAGETLRRRIEAVFDTALEPRAAALNRAIFLGHAHLLDRRTRDDFTRCGLAHIFSVSGLHVAIIFWVLDTFVRLFNFQPRWRSSVLIVLLILLCAVTGFRAPAVRAAIMFGCLLASNFLRYKVEPLTALATAGLVILLLWPRALWQASFQMSFLCMLSIILLKPPLDAWLCLNTEKGSRRRQRLAEWVNHHVISLLTIVLSAQIALVPLLAHYYHVVPVVGFLSNVIVAPLVFAMLTTTLILLGVDAIVPAAFGIIGDALNLASHALTSILHVWADLPLASVFMPAWPIPVGMLYFLLLFGWTVLPHEPSPFYVIKQRVRLYLTLAAVAAWIVWAPAVLGRANTDLRATFLDVGQGDSCVLELPGGAVVVVDGGPIFGNIGEFVVAPFLESRGIDHVDAVIVTHPDADHVGGLPAVFDQLHVAWLIEGEQRSASRAYQRLCDSALAEGSRHDTVFAGDWISAPMGARIVFLHPPREATYSNRNEASLVLMVDWWDREILIAGDIESRGERDLLASTADLRCDVLKVAHHGSASATSRTFLERTEPQLAVISCGRDNQYGHPAPTVVERLMRAGIAIARTDLEGAVTVRCDGGTFVWFTEGKR